MLETGRYWGISAIWLGLCARKVPGGSAISALVSKGYFLVSRFGLGTNHLTVIQVEPPPMLSLQLMCPRSRWHHADVWRTCSRVLRRASGERTRIGTIDSRPSALDISRYSGAPIGA